MLPAPENEKILSVAELNRDVEPFVIQASAARTMFFKDPFKPLQFVHFSDIRATDWPHWCDGKRVRGSRSYDCFNLVSVDVNQNLLKLVRIGNNADHYLRIKRVLCYDYAEKKVIFNG